MERIKIVTDSAADLSPEQLLRNDIAVVPITVNFGDDSYRDGVDLTNEEFYRKLKTSTEMPRTSQPSPSAFADTYRSLAPAADIVLSIHISGRLSGVLNSAHAASLMVDQNVITVDTKTASQGIGRSVLIAAEAIRRGFRSQEILNVVKESVSSTFSVFAVDTLDHLRRNGRIGRAAALLGSVLQIKPILYADRDGMVAAYDKVRGRSQVIARLVSAAQENVAPGSRVNVSVVHSGPENQAYTLLARLAETFQLIEQHVGMVGPAIGAHVGPGCLGLMIQPAFEELVAQAAIRHTSVAN
jgi:DegV family protein with EDD domain